MEALSLLKYWRAGGGGPGGGATTTVPEEKSTTKTIVTAAAVSPYSSDGEDGPYFDLEFALPDQDNDSDEQASAESQENDMKRVQTEDESETESEEMSVHDDDEDDEEAELKFSLSSNENTALSPSDDLFFKGDLVSIEPSSILLNTSEENSKLPVFLVKSATKFRVLMLKLKKSKSVNGENIPEAVEKSGRDEACGGGGQVVERESHGKASGKLFVKFKVEEAPLLNLFTRDNSSKENHGKATKQDSDSNSAAAADDRKLSKEVMNKYLKMVKPFYIRVSKRYVEKLKFSGHAAGPSKGSCAPSPPSQAAAAAPTNAKSSQHKQGKNLQAGLKVVRKHLGKSRSASAAAVPPPPAKVVSDRRDDSLLQLQDGIQGAILHCKKSFNASRDVESPSSILFRSVSDPSYKSIVMPKFTRASSSTSSGEEAKN